MTLAGFPHSDIPGSKPACGSPRLIAACHVLLRLSAPRHPPCTLSSLTKMSAFSEFYRLDPIQLSKNQMIEIWDLGEISHLGHHPVPPASLVELIGFEPTTSALQRRRSPS
jgi:hypothetical protein